MSARVMRRLAPRRMRQAYAVVGREVYEAVAYIVAEASQPVEWEHALKAALIMLAAEDGMERLDWLRANFGRMLDVGRTGFIDALLRRSTPGERDGLLRAIADAAAAEEAAEP